MSILNDGPPRTVVLCPAPDQLSLLIRIGTGIVSSSYALRMDILARKGFFGKTRDKRFNGYDGVLRLLGFDVDMNVSLSSLRKKRRLRHHGATRLLLHDWFFCCPPMLRPKVRHLFRILGASRTRGMTPSIQNNNISKLYRWSRKR